MKSRCQFTTIWLNRVLFAFSLSIQAPPPPNTSHNKCEGTYEYIFQQGQVVIQYLDWDPSHVDLIYWAYASVCEDLCVCVRELEMSVCLWLEDVCKLKKIKES